jgi:hypothetical protein
MDTHKKVPWFCNNLFYGRNPMTSALVRKPFCFEEEREEELFNFDELAQDAANILGYRVLLNELPKRHKQAR